MKGKKNRRNEPPKHSGKVPKGVDEDQISATTYQKGPFFIHGSSNEILQDPNLEAQNQPSHEKNSGGKKGVASAFRRASLKVINMLVGNKKNDESIENVGLIEILDQDAKKKLQDDYEDEFVKKDLSQLMDHYRGEHMEHKKDHKVQPSVDFSYTEILKTLMEQGIPIASDEDYVRLEGSYGKKWDPDGTVVEYYSPVLRSFIPINMRGRYRGCWAEDVCIQGLNVSKISPKPEALEGAFDRCKKEKIEKKYEEMFEVAQDEAHLDYLIEMAKCQAETLPVSIMYDVLNFGLDVLKTNLETIVIDEGVPPTDRVYQTTETLTLNMRRKLQIYAELGLEPLQGEHEALHGVEPMWTLTKDQLIKSTLQRRHKPDEYEQMLQDVRRVHEEMGLYKGDQEDHYEGYVDLPPEGIPQINKKQQNSKDVSSTLPSKAKDKPADDKGPKKNKKGAVAKPSGAVKKKQAKK